MSAEEIHREGDERGNMRAVIMKACARATDNELRNAVRSVGTAHRYAEIRPPHTGLVMIRGRVGASGNAFNIGEATVTRAAVRLDTGVTGYAWQFGRSHERAKLAALIDALGQDSASVEIILNEFVEPVTERWSREKLRKQEETAATKVDFFTLVRGED